MQAVIDFFVGLGNWFLQTFNAFVAWLFALIKAFVFTIADLAQDLACWLLDQMLSLVVYLLHVLDLSNIPSISTYFNQLPESVTTIMGLLGVGNAASVIVAAILVRLAMQLIPFTRLGS